MHTSRWLYDSRCEYSFNRIVATTLKNVCIKNGRLLLRGINFRVVKIVVLQKNIAGVLKEWTLAPRNKMFEKENLILCAF